MAVGARHNWRTIVGGVALALAVGAWIVLIPIWHRQGQQAAQGQMARDRQQATFPVALKVYEDAARRGVITTDDLACFRFASACPARPASTP